MNNKLIRSIIALSAVVILGGCILIGGTNKKDKIEPTDSFKVTSAEPEKVDLIFDAQNLVGADKDKIDKMLNKKGESIDSYSFSYGSDDLLYIDDKNKCLYLSLSSVIKEKNLGTDDKNKIMTQFGIDLEGATCVNNQKEMIYSGIKNYSGEIKFSYNDNDELETIVFYPNGTKAAEDFKNTITAKSDASVAIAKESKKDNNKTTTNTDATTTKSEVVQEVLYGEEPVDFENYQTEVLTEESNKLIDKIKNNDQEYIDSLEEKAKTRFAWTNQKYFNSEDFEVDQLVNEWGIEREDFIAMIALNINVESRRTTHVSSLVYFVGAKSGNIIILPQDGIYDAYQIKDGKVVKTYHPINEPAKQWR